MNVGVKHLPVVTAEAEAETPARRLTALAVRTADVVLAGLLLLVVLPMLLLIALAVRLDSPGPALFRQERLGRGRRTFRMNKFRSMRSDADPKVHQTYVQSLISGDEDKAEDGLYKLAGDARITRVGSFLRKTSLDELPQLWNVIRGDMSLVGPRPVIGYEAEVFPPHWHGRFEVKPGITGLWQVSGRNERTYEEMVALDLEFVRSFSLRSYVSILARTVWVVLLRRGAA